MPSGVTAYQCLFIRAWLQWVINFLQRACLFLSRCHKEDMNKLRLTFAFPHRMSRLHCRCSTISCKLLKRVSFAASRLFHVLVGDDVSKFSRGELQQLRVEGQNKDQGVKVSRAKLRNVPKVMIKKSRVVVLRLFVSRHLGNSRKEQSLDNPWSLSTLSSVNLCGEV